jgi:hypothetical protein
MLPPTMRGACWALVSLVAAGCAERALTVGAPGADGGPPPSDAAPAEVAPRPGSVAAAAPAGTAAAGGGATTLGPLVALHDGGVVVAGSFSGTVSFAADKTLAAVGTRDAFVARYRQDMRLVWVHPMSGGEVVIAGAALLAGDEIVVAGWFSGTLTVSAATAAAPARVLTAAGGLDGFAARLASDGSVRWAVRAGAAGDDIVRAVAAAPELVGPDGAMLPGAIMLTGTVGDGAVFGPGEPGATAVPAGDGPIFAARIGPADGALVWARFAGSGVPAQGYDVATDAAGSAAVITGYVNGPAAFGAGAPGAVRIDPAAGRAFVARFDGAGHFTWAKGLGGPVGEGDAVALTAAGGVLVSGTFEGQGAFAGGAAPIVLTADSPGQPGCFLAGLAAVDGGVTWARRVAGRGLRPWRLRRAAGGDLLLAASFGGGVLLDPDGAAPARVTSAGNDDALFMRLDPAGGLRWATAAGGLGDDEGGDVAEASDGFVWGSGLYVGPVTVGAGASAVTLLSGTDGAGFLLRLWP